MNFKDMLAQDAREVFLNPLEFGEARMIDGRETIILVDDDLLQKRRSMTNNPSDGVYSAALIFYVLKSSMPQKPVVGADMKLDKRTFKVSDVQEDESVYTITLKRAGS